MLDTTHIKDTTLKNHELNNQRKEIKRENLFGNFYKYCRHDFGGFLFVYRTAGYFEFRFAVENGGWIGGCRIYGCCNCLSFLEKNK